MEQHSVLAKPIRVCHDSGTPGCRPAGWEDLTAGQDAPPRAESRLLDEPRKAVQSLSQTAGDVVLNDEEPVAESLESREDPWVYP
ncbi:hypothetical protein CMUS01_10465 [Colletotrichum musicola]|uniref:Uncharacterized protein n=1 Tax=Colletotrichum musicola TaxID=2175873 RepID=A0A8H6K3T5_9PEZI|nr:hypothetical protein CMUS01_10465 [Colletotrichum musicola]